MLESWVQHTFSTEYQHLKKSMHHPWKPPSSSQQPWRGKTGAKGHQVSSNLQAKAFSTDRNKTPRILSIIHQKKLMSSPCSEMRKVGQPCPKETFPHQRLQAKGWLSSNTPCQLLRNQPQVPDNQCFLSATVGDSSTSKEKRKKSKLSRNRQCS